MRRSHKPPRYLIHNRSGKATLADAIAALTMVTLELAGSFHEEQRHPKDEIYAEKRDDDKAMLLM